MMKRLGFTIVLAGLSGSALAADLRGPIIEAPPPLPYPVAAFSWTGVYAGVNVGLGAASTDYGYKVDTPATSTQGYSQHRYSVPAQDGYDVPGYYVPGTSTSASSVRGSQSPRSGGVLGGVQVGYNYALLGYGGFGGGFGGHGVGALPVIGIEADFDGSSIGSSTSLDSLNAGYVGVGSKFDYFGTVRGRLGLAFDRLLVYGTGGFAYAQTEGYVDSPGNLISARKSNFHTGIAYGGGVEFALTNNLLLRAEYLHYDFNNKGIAGGSVDGWNTYSIYEKPRLDVVRAGLSYKFNALVAPPVIARY